MDFLTGGEFESMTDPLIPLTPIPLFPREVCLNTTAAHCS
jgi:hypothetical protein